MSRLARYPDALRVERVERGLIVGTYPPETTNIDLARASAIYAEGDELAPALVVEIDGVIWRFVTRTQADAQSAARQFAVIAQGAA